MSSIVFPPVGHCIYCGAKDVDLTKEHIIPYGLNGGLILPSSSCKPCAALTSKIELCALRGEFRNLRLKYKSRTRRPAQRPTGFLSTKAPLNDPRPPVDGKEFTLSPDLLTDTGGWIFPDYKVAGIILGKMPFEANSGGARGMISSADASVLAKLENNKTIAMKHTLNRENFGRLIAKIGHAYATALLGPDGFKPYLPSLIRSSHLFINHLIGTDPSTRIKDE